MEGVHRLWSQPYLCHGFTINYGEWQSWLNSGNWTDEGIGWYDYPYQASGTLPVYRFWSPVYTSHHYTIDETEKNFIISTWPQYWTYEGVAFYAYPSP